MPFEPDAKIDLSDALCVSLAGREWFIPVLPLRQTIKITALAAKLRGIGAEPTEAQMMDLAHVVHIALTRAYPGLGFDAFLDMPVTFAEMILAAPTILRQTRALHELRGDPAPGEAQAASQSIG